MENLVRVRRAAEIYGCDRRRIYQLINEGRLNSVKIYGVLLVDVDEVKRLSQEIAPRGVPRKNVLRHVLGQDDNETHYRRGVDQAQKNEKFFEKS